MSGGHTPSVLIVQHVEVEGPGTIADALASRGVEMQMVRTYLGDPVPARLDTDGLIVMGGPMGVYDVTDHPQLVDEMELIRDAVSRDAPVLGVCLGAQLLAATLGADVRPGPRKEIGWAPIRLEGSAATEPLLHGLPADLTAFHWHGDVFDLPSDAMPLASSALTRCQGFRYGRAAYGLLFHLEVTGPAIRAMVTTFEAELASAGIESQPILDATRNHLTDVQRLADTIFGRWADLVIQRSSRLTVAAQ